MTYHTYQDLMWMCSGIIQADLLQLYCLATTLQTRKWTVIEKNHSTSSQECTKRETWKLLAVIFKTKQMSSFSSCDTSNRLKIKNHVEVWNQLLKCMWRWKHVCVSYHLTDGEINCMRLKTWLCILSSYPWRNDSYEDEKMIVYPAILLMVKRTITRNDP